MKSSAQLPVGCVILAAGNAVRFGENKLLADVGGKAMITRAFEAVPAEQLSDIAVVTQYKSVVDLADAYGIRSIINRHPELGISRSVRLGTEALQDRCGGILYLVSDQPWLKRESVERMLEIFWEHPECIVSMSSDGKRGNPGIFPKEFFGELCSLSGDRGGRAVIARHPDRLILCEVDSAELIDVDTPDDLTHH